MEGYICYEIQLLLIKHFWLSKIRQITSFRILWLRAQYTVSVSWATVRSAVRIFSLLPWFAFFGGFSFFHPFLPERFSLFVTSFLRLFGWLVISFFYIYFSFLCLPLVTSYLFNLFFCYFGCLFICFYHNYFVKILVLLLCFLVASLCFISSPCFLFFLPTGSEVSHLMLNEVSARC